MTVIVAGTVRVPPANLEVLRPHMLAQLKATRAEDGCEEYCYAEDVAEPGLIRVYEVWRDRPALKAHIAAPHMAAWRAAGEAHGLSDRRLVMHEVERSRPL